MDAIYTFRHYTEDTGPRLAWPKRTGRRTTYPEWLRHQFMQHHEDEPPAGTPTATASVFVNHGRWLWQCPGCLTAVQVSGDDGAEPLFCPACFGQQWVQPVFPDDRAEIEAELMRQPGYRWNSPFRNWEPGWSMAYLQERTAKAQAQMALGAKFVRSASIGTPRTWSVGEVLTAANMNAYIREIQKDLIGTNGPIEIENALVLDSLSTAERDALSQLNGMLLYNSTLERLQVRESGAYVQWPKIHQSQLFAGGAVTTVNHDIGLKPVMFQAVLERVESADHHGYSQGEQVFPMQTQFASSPGLFVHSVTDTQYIVVFTPDSNQAGQNAYRRAHIVSKTTGLRTQVNVDNNPTSTDPLGGWGVRAVAIG